MRGNLSILSKKSYNLLDFLCQAGNIFIYMQHDGEVVRRIVFLFYRDLHQENACSLT